MVVIARLRAACDRCPPLTARLWAFVVTVGGLLGAAAWHWLIGVVTGRW